MGTIAIPGFPTGMLVPGIYINVELGKAPPSAAGTVRRVLLIGKNSAGAADAGKLYKVSRLSSRAANSTVNPDMASAQDLFGVDEVLINKNDISSVPTKENTGLYWMCKAALKANPFVALYAIKVDGSDVKYANVLDINEGVVAGQRFHYIAVDSATDAVAGDVADDLAAYLRGLANPISGLRQQGIIGSVAKSTTAPTLSFSEPRAQHVWAPFGNDTAFLDSSVALEDTDIQSTSTDDDNMKWALKKGLYYTDGMLAAAVAATRAKHEAVDPAVNLCKEPILGMPKVPKEHQVKRTALNKALQDGTTPLVTVAGKTAILRSVTTAASDVLSPVLDTVKVTVSDYVADDIEVKMISRYTGFKLAPDTDVAPPPRTATPNLIKGSLIEWLRNHQASGLIVLVDELAERVKVEIDDNVDGRVNFEIPEDVIEIFAVGAGNVIQIG